MVCQELVHEVSGEDEEGRGALRAVSGMRLRTIPVLLVTLAGSCYPRGNLPMPLCGHAPGLYMPIYGHAPGATWPGRIDPETGSPR
jgi:hypothetical protein